MTGSVGPALDAHPPSKYQRQFVTVGRSRSHGELTGLAELGPGKPSPSKLSKRGPNRGMLKHLAPADNNF
ncbi:MAG: hypothetical protein KatS3mg111_1083 [Pirellulaceae bacterium]|nr:MAG: hypothetical protein KatS3mg111_1083 [Pirellulaceae bacterium]